MKAQAKAHSYRLPGGVVRVAMWHGCPDIATIAVRGVDAPSPRTLERLLDRLRDDGYRQVLTNAVGPATSAWLVEHGFAVQGRLHLLEHALDQLSRPSRRTRKATRADRDAIVEVDAASFDEFWRFDELALREAMRATPHAHTRVASSKDVLLGYGLFGRAGATGYVQRLAVGPSGQGRGLGRALLNDGLRWLQLHGATRALVNTQEDNARALDLYLRAGFTRLPVGLCVLGRDL
ncbi:MAG TPA: GNAT family N-acetyltransferase [Acidimicrobiia bacterium]|nr:GNAT family N-acetyltransferase [Acidimicrobiia bacterium]